MNDDANWEKFEENFNLVYDNFMVKILEKFPDLKKNDRKLCAYLRMGLSSKEMASLMNTSVRSIDLPDPTESFRDFFRFSKI